MILRDECLARIKYEDMDQNEISYIYINFLELLGRQMNLKFTLLVYFAFIS